MLRLAGRTKELNDATTEIAKAANEFSSAEEVFEAAVALFANHRAEEATKILLERKQNLGLLAEVLIARLRYTEALKLFADRTDRALTPEEKLAFDLRRARILMLTGDREGAVQLFNQVVDGLRKESPERQRSSFSTITAAVALTRPRCVGLKRPRGGACTAQFVESGIFDKHGPKHRRVGIRTIIRAGCNVSQALFWMLRQKENTR